MRRYFQFISARGGEKPWFTLVFTVAALAFPFAARYGGGAGWLWLAGVAVYGPWCALLAEPGPAIERRLKSHHRTLGYMITHNQPDDGTPSNAAWNAAVITIEREGHLYADASFKYTSFNDTITIKWIP